MDRRHYLALVGSGLALSTAGCVGGDDDNGGETEMDNSDESTDNGDDSSNGGDSKAAADSEKRPVDDDTPAEWANWLAADMILGRTDIAINRIDLQELREHIPDLYAELGVAQIAETYMISEQSINQILFIERADATAMGVVV